jgi:hypothetical protein
MTRPSGGRRSSSSTGACPTGWNPGRGRTEVPPIFFVFVAAPWFIYMGVTGLTASLVWDYRRDRWGRRTYGCDQVAFRDSRREGREGG